MGSVRKGGAEIVCKVLMCHEYHSITKKTVSIARELLELALQTHRLCIIIIVNSQTFLGVSFPPPHSR